MRSNSAVPIGLLDHKQPLFDAAGLIDQFGQMLQAAFDVEI